MPKKRKFRLTRQKMGKKGKKAESLRLPPSLEPIATTVIDTSQKEPESLPPTLVAEITTEYDVDEPVSETLPPTLVAEHVVATIANNSDKLLSEDPIETAMVADDLDPSFGEKFLKNHERFQISRFSVTEFPKQSPPTENHAPSRKKKKNCTINKKKSKKYSLPRSIHALGSKSPYMAGPVHKTAIASVAGRARQLINTSTVNSPAPQSSVIPSTNSKGVPSRSSVQRSTIVAYLDHNYAATSTRPVTDSLESEKIATVEPEITENDTFVNVNYSSHHATLQLALSAFLSSERFSDVTLVSQEGRLLKCHKVILSACSEFMDKLLSNVTSFYQFQHPVIFLRNVPFVILEAICRFIYVGQADVPERELDLFVKVAESLKIKGLVSESALPDEVIEKDKETPSPNDGIILKVNEDATTKSTKAKHLLGNRRRPKTSGISEASVKRARLSEDDAKKTETTNVRNKTADNDAILQETNTTETWNGPVILQEILTSNNDQSEIAYSDHQFFNIDEIKSEPVDVEYGPLIFEEKEDGKLNELDFETRISTILSRVKDEEETTDIG